MATIVINEKAKKEREKEQRLKHCYSQRREAYRDESDPLVMKMIRGEVDSDLGRVPTKEDIAAKIADIKKKFPKE